MLLGTLEALHAARWRIAVVLTAAMMVLYFGFILLVAYDKPLLTHQVVPGLTLGILLGALVIVAAWVSIGVYVRWANRLRHGGRRAAGPGVTGAMGEPNLLTIAGFFLFIALSLGITYVAARRTTSAEQVYAAGRSLTALQNGMALAGDYMSAASTVPDARTARASVSYATAFIGFFLDVLKMPPRGSRCEIPDSSPSRSRSRPPSSWPGSDRSRKQRPASPRSNGASTSGPTRTRPTRSPGNP